jgi:hypothetical protein
VWRSKKDRNYYWRFVQSNGRVTATGGDDGYTRRNTLLRSLKNMGLKLAGGTFEIAEREV